MRYAIGILTILLLVFGCGICLTYIVSRIVKVVKIKKRLKENNKKMNCQNCRFYTYDEDEDGNALESCDRFGCYMNEIAGLKPDDGCIKYEPGYFPRRDL